MKKQNGKQKNPLQRVNKNASLHQLSFDSLPLEILTCIFEYIEPIERIRLERVSKLWKKASRDSWMKTRELCIIEPQCKHSHATGRLVIPCEGVKDEDAIMMRGSELHVANENVKILQNFLSRVGRFITSFTHDFPSSTNGQRIHSIVARYCHNIEKLTITDIGDCDKKTFKRLFEVNKKINSISINSSTNIFEAIPTRNWKSLRLSPDVRDTIRCEKKTIAMLNSSKALEEFGSWNSWTPNIMNAVLKHERLKRLQLLVNSQSKELGKLLFEIPKLKYLEELVIAYDKIEEALLVQFFEDLSENCHNLRTLEIHYDEFPVKGIEAISTLPKLTRLALLFNKLNDHQLLHLTKFKCLSLCFYEDINEPSDYTEEGLLKMIENAENLERLDVTGLRISWKTLKKMLNELAKRRKPVKVFVPHSLRNKAFDYGQFLKSCKIG